MFVKPIEEEIHVFLSSIRSKRRWAIFVLCEWDDVREKGLIALKRRGVMVQAHYNI